TSPSPEAGAWAPAAGWAFTPALPWGPPCANAAPAVKNANETIATLAAAMLRRIDMRIMGSSLVFSGFLQFDLVERDLALGRRQALVAGELGALRRYQRLDDR